MLAITQLLENAFFTVANTLTPPKKYKKLPKWYIELLEI